MYTIVNGQTRTLRLPAPSDLAMLGVTWGAFDELLTPAYWRGQTWQYQLLGRYTDLRLGRNLVEEVAACLLGGYGMPAELGLAAYARLRDRGLLNGTPGVKVLENVLLEPFLMRTGLRRYRFPAQKARYLAACLERLADFEEPEHDFDLREGLTKLPGIGLKTASWVTRNYRGSDAVAIVDVHILRAGRALKLFPSGWEPQSHYRELEGKFLAFAKAIGTPAGLLDGVMWDHMRRLPDKIFTPRQLSLAV